MIHTVVWAESAAAELAAIWIASSDRPLITTLVRDIDERLRVAPESAGESREAAFRILIAGLLAVTFEIRPADRIVRGTGRVGRAARMRSWNAHG